MPKQTAKRQTKTVRHKRTPQAKKLRRSKKRARAKKPAAQEGQVVGATAVTRQSLQPYAGGQFADALEDAEPGVVEVMEIEVMHCPKDPQEIDETAIAVNLPVLEDED